MGVFFVGALNPLLYIIFAEHVDASDLEKHRRRNKSR
jgi:hypothetical protein